MEKKTYKKGVIIGIVNTLVIVMILSIVFNTIPAVAGLPFKVKMSTKSKINTIYELLDKNYVDDYDKDKTEEAMYYGLVAGIGDPYTSYMDSSTFEKFMEQTEGTYAGIGAVVSVDPEDNTVVIVLPYEGAPAANAGVMPGDKIIKINETPVTGDMLDEAVSMMKGTPGTSVNVTLKSKDGSIKDVEIVRQKVIIPTVSHKMLDNNIGYIKVTNFERVTLDQFNNAYDDLTAKNMKGLVLDLRNNPGGLLDVVCQMTDRLVPEGYIVYTEDKNGKREYINSDAEKINIPLAVLINGNSASASEVMSGAIKDLGVGVLVGEQSFGKGLVQNIFPLQDGSAVKITIAKYYTPSGVCIQGEGLTPDYIVPMSEEDYMRLSTLELDDDPQLKKSIEVISSSIQ